MKQCDFKFTMLKTIVFSGVFSLIFGCFNLYQDWDKLRNDGFFHGYTWATWSVILIQVSCLHLPQHMYIEVHTRPEFYYHLNYLLTMNGFVTCVP